MRIQQLFPAGSWSRGADAPLAAANACNRALAWCRSTARHSTGPLLRNRFVLNRVRAPVLPPHLDLLHCARRVLRSRLRSVRLVELERQVLGMYREDDVSGALIPQLYFDYLDGGDVSPIAKVIEHNANDLIALAALVAELVNHFDQVHGGDDPP